MYPACAFPSIACVIDIDNATIENFNAVVSLYTGKIADLKLLLGLLQYAYLNRLKADELIKIRGIGV